MSDFDWTEYEILKDSPGLHAVEKARMEDVGERYQRCCCYFDDDNDGLPVTMCNHHKVVLDELRSVSAENKRLEALDKDWLRASEQWADENSTQVEALARMNERITLLSTKNTIMREELTQMTYWTGRLSPGAYRARLILERVSTEPAPDGINDRGSDEYANPERDGDRQ